MEKEKPLLSKWDKEIIGACISGMSLATGLYMLFDTERLIVGEFTWVLALVYIILGFHLIRVISHRHYYNNKKRQ